MGVLRTTISPQTVLDDKEWEMRWIIVLVMMALGQNIAGADETAKGEAEKEANGVV